MTIAPLQLKIYKGITGKHGAIQFNLQRPHYFCSNCPKMKDYKSIYPQECQQCHEKMRSREGALFMEITSAEGPNKYAWHDKIVFALSVTDLGQILMVLEGLEPKVEITHDPGAKTETQGKIRKRLLINSPKGIKAGVMITATETKAGPSKDTMKHTVPLSGYEARILSICFRQVIPASLGW